MHSKSLSTQFIDRFRKHPPTEVSKSEGLWWLDINHFDGPFEFVTNTVYIWCKADKSRRINAAHISTQVPHQCISIQPPLRFLASFFSYQVLTIETRKTRSGSDVLQPGACLQIWTPLDPVLASLQARVLSATKSEILIRYAYPHSLYFLG